MVKWQLALMSRKNEDLSVAQWDLGPENHTLLDRITNATFKNSATAQNFGTMTALITLARQKTQAKFEVKGLTLAREP